MKKRFVFTLLALLALCGPASAGTIRMAYLQNDLHHLPLWVAQDKGLFAREGVDVTIAGVFRAGPEIMTAFAAGSLDMAYVGEAPATIAFARGNHDIRVIAQVNTEGSALVVAKDGPIHAVKDLKGRKVAVPGNGSVQDFLLRRSLEKQGVASADVRIITIGPAEMGNALENGQIDAYVAWQPYPARSVLSGKGRVLAASSDLWAGHPCCALVMSRKAAPDDVKAVLRAHVEAIAYIREHPEEAVRSAVKHTGMDEATVREALSHVTYTPAPSFDGEEEYVRFLNTFGYIKVEDSKAFTNGFIDAGLMKGM